MADDASGREYGLGYAGRDEALLRVSMLDGAAVADRLAFGTVCVAATVAAIGRTGGVIDAGQVRVFLAERGT